jgi:hypothetical protein
MEIWKPALECFSHVEVSNLANVRTVDTERVFIRKGKLSSQKLPGKKISYQMSAHGYYLVGIQFEGKRPKFFVHRLVARTFVDGWKEGLCVNHINGIKTDNRPENLEWVTLARNTEHQWETGLVNLRGEAHPSAKLSAKQAIEIFERSNKGEKTSTIAKEFGVSSHLVTMIRDKQRWASVLP